MYLIQQITSNPFQQQILTLPDGTTLSLTIYFIPQQYGWFITSLTYKTFTLQGVRITNSPNILYQFQNQIPFGLACFSSQNREPTQQNDFVSGANILFLLDATDVAGYTGLIENG